MTQIGSTSMPFGGVALLERAIGYTLGSLQLVTPDAIAKPTPCRDWDLRALLAHMNDSFVALQEAADLGRIEVAKQADEPDASTADPVAALRSRACQVLGAWTSSEGIDPICIGGCAVTSSMVTCAGSLEIAVHGWDVALACGRKRPLPPALADELLACAPTFVTDEDRPTRFAAPVHLRGTPNAGDRLLALLGREPNS